MQNDKGSESSYLVNRAVIAAWLIFCVAAVLFGHTALGVLFGAVFLLTLTSYLWARAALKNVGFSLSAEQTYLFPQQRFSITRTIDNRKMLPLLWAEVREACDMDACALPDPNVVIEYTSPCEDGTTSITYERLYSVPLIKWRHAARVADEWEAKRRGILEISSAVVRSGDGFGLAAIGKTFPLPSPVRITVFPRRTNVSVDAILQDMWDSRSASGGYLKDRTIIKTVRDYLPGDHAKDVNMRLLARGQGLKTNTFEIVTPDTVLFVLDAATFRPVPAPEFERALSVLGSLIAGLTERGIRVSLMTSASRFFPETCTEPSAGDRARLAMLELLAAVSRQDESFSAGASGKMPDEPGRVYYAAGEPEPPDFRRLTERYPEHKVQALLPDAISGADRGIRVRGIFEFERVSSW
ncbi:MAG: DUF58 domain-containing protein [Clostridiales Family XIII bacterium]|nr:DUF58 domain-containing protein [Clostridiales Family XIII bacterium]